MMDEATILEKFLRRVQHVIEEMKDAPQTDQYALALLELAVRGLKNEVNALTEAEAAERGKQYSTP